MFKCWLQTFNISDVCIRVHVCIYLTFFFDPVDFIVCLHRGTIKFVCTYLPRIANKKEVIIIKLCVHIISADMKIVSPD